MKSFSKAQYTMKTPTGKTATLALLIIIMVSLASCQAPFANPPAANPFRIRTATALCRDLTVKAEVSGVLLPASTANISSKVSGRVDAVEVSVGGSVKAGQILVRLDGSDLELQLRQARVALEAAENQAAQARVSYDSAKAALELTNKTINDQIEQTRIALDNARINLENAQTAMERARAIYEIDAMAQSDLEKAQTAYAQSKNQFAAAELAYNQAKTTGAQNQRDGARTRLDAAEIALKSANGVALDSAKIAIEQIEKQISNMIIKAPSSGVVVNINANPGEMVAPNSTIVSVADLMTLRLKGTISQETLARVSVGDNVNVTVDIYPGAVYPAKILSVGPISVSTGGYFPIEMELSNPDLALTAGLSARAGLEYTISGALLVPAGAVFSESGSEYVFMIKDGRAAKTPVLTGAIHESERQILSGLAEGDIVAVTGVSSLTDAAVVFVETP